MLINNYSKLPTSLIQVTDRHLSLITFSAGDITNIIQNLNSNKAYGHDNISIRMLKICGDTISKPLQLIFKQALITGIYPSDWKKGNIILFTKKEISRILKITAQCLYYRYVAKFLKGFYLIMCLVFFLENNLITQKQSGFKPGHSFINRFLSITHEVYKSFDDGFEVRSVFLDISKAFDKVWHQGIIFKLRQNGISGDLLNILSDFKGLCLMVKLFLGQS